MKARMHFGNLTSTLLIITSFFCVQSAPAKPLNERSAQLTWQAWILVDDQNQNKQYSSNDDTIPKRRITPKSIFISPLIDQCGPGFTPDPNGKCIKLVPLDNDAHMKFILEYLNSKFSNNEDYEEEEGDDDEENLPTPGPFQLNIPLNVDYPTIVEKNDTMNNSNNTKRDSLHPPIPSQVDAPLIITKIKVDNDEEESRTITTTTIPTTTIDDVLITSTLPTEESVTEMITTIREDATGTITTTEDIPLTTTTTITTTTTVTTTVQPETTTSEQVEEEAQALFFKIKPDEQHDVATNFDADDHQKDNFIRFPDDSPSPSPTSSNPSSIDSSSLVKLNPQKFNHRSRDKWFFPNSHNPSRRNNLYREIPVENLPYIFNVKHRSGSSQR